MSTNPRARVVILGVLELIVGGIVVLGGAVLAYFSNDATGMSLGVVHPILGLSAFPAAFLLLTDKVGARTLALGVDAVIIVFSAVSEIILSTTGSLSSGPFFRLYSWNNRGSSHRRGNCIPTDGSKPQTPTSG